LKTVKKNIHRGKILQAAVEDKGISIDVLTKKAGYSRGAYYNHIRKADLADKILEKYARVMQYDFFEEIPDFKTSVAAEPEIPYLTKPRDRAT
jgi:AcrR family transcriptional regulator